jgi:hypothetical protein
MKKLLFMKRGASWTTGSGVNFTREHPYQLVNESEIPTLLQEDRFIEASKEDVKKFYNLKEDIK